jgi:hypothetical protein
VSDEAWNEQISKALNPDTMPIGHYVLGAIRHANHEEFEPALLLACIAVDKTSERLYSPEDKVGVRFIDCLRSYYWLIEPMIGFGINLVDARFDNIKLKHNAAPDLAEIIYEVCRSNLAQGDEAPMSFAVTKPQDGIGSTWYLAENRVHVPDRLVWALLAVAVFSRVNADIKTTGPFFLSLGNEQFVISQWWGREDDFRPIADRYNTTRVKPTA